MRTTCFGRRLEARAQTRTVFGLMPFDYDRPCISFISSFLDMLSIVYKAHNTHMKYYNELINSI